MRVLQLAVAIAATIPITSALAAQSAPVPVGAHVRVRADGGTYVGTFEALTADSIRLSRDRETIAIARGRVSELDIADGTRAQALQGAGYGLLIGAAAGGIAGAALYSPCQRSCIGGPRDRTDSAFFGAVILGAVGLGGGAIAGALHRTDRWRVVPNGVSVGF